MDASKPLLPLLEQREIEARIVGPLVRAFASELGQERALAIVRQVIRELARQSGGELARSLGEQTLQAFARSLDRWRENGALQIDVLEQTPEKLSFNVTRCRYAEMYRALGLADLGANLSCQRDYALAQGFNPNIRLELHSDDHGRRSFLRFPVSVGIQTQRNVCRVARGRRARAGTRATRRDLLRRQCHRVSARAAVVPTIRFDWCWATSQACQP